ncbi:MAG: patatin-like phospholipase family protein [Pyrinomonadaceae bacterium]
MDKNKEMKSGAELIVAAREILRGKAAAATDTYLLAEQLRQNSVFSYARRLFAQLRKSQAAELDLQSLLAVADPSASSEERAKHVNTTLALKHSICTYEDPDLAVDTRFNTALEILSGIEELSETINPKILASAGDIYARKWEHDNQQRTLEQAYWYYYRGYKEARKLNFSGEYYQGYTGINAAFLLDQLSQLELDKIKEINPKAPHPKTLFERRNETEQIRKELITSLSALANRTDELSPIRTWYLLSILAEASFGLGEYKQADAWLKRASTLEGIPDNKYEKIVRRLIAVYRFREPELSADRFRESEAGKALIGFVRPQWKSNLAVDSLFMGKVGLALSGNGLRASLFQIGVLAKLAELGVLRNVEILSCSSGGSIVGTHYYLELRQLLQNKADDDINDEDYVALVTKVEERFLTGVQRDLQTRSKTNPWANLKAVIKKNYSHTDRLGELFQREIFSKVGGEPKPACYLDELTIKPKGEPDSFTPKKDNWRRAAKVPVLVLNATTLNTGHNWRFTAAWMGEPAGPINSEIDGNVRLRRVAFVDATSDFRRFEIGRAVAACASSPDLLEPIAIDDLYPDMTVRLIDGGVSEPLAITALNEYGCTIAVVVDGSGQTDTQNNPRTAVDALASRAHRISTSHLREAQYDWLLARYRASFPQGLMFIHLKEDIDVTSLDRVGAPSSIDTESEQQPLLTTYGVRREVQERLAKIRAEFDAFSDTEAYALMTSGYLITESQFIKSMGAFAPHPTAERPKWRFLAVEEQMKRVGDSDILKLLEVAHNRILRIWRLSHFLRSITLPVLLSIPIMLYALRDKLPNFESLRTNPTLWDDVLFYVLLLVITSSLVVAVVFLVVVPLMLLALIILKFRHREKTAGQILKGLAILMVGWIGAAVQLAVFDRWYLALGNIKDRFSPGDKEAKPSNFRLALQTVGDKIDKASKESYDSISKAINRSDTVDAVSRLFEASGYEVARFPRDTEINPFQLNLDLYAFKGNHRIFADVKMGPEAVDWKAASGLKTAASVLTVQSEGDDTEQRDVEAMLILIDVKPDPSLSKFSRKEGVKVVELTTDTFKHIVDSRGNTQELLLEAQHLNLFARSEESAATSSFA